MHAYSNADSCIAMRPSQAANEAFLFTVYASTRESEMALVNWPASSNTSNVTAAGSHARVSSARPITASNAVAPSGTGTACSPALGVGPVRLPGLLDWPQIVTRRGADEIDRAEFDRWAEPLAETVPRVLAEDLAALWKTDRVAVFCETNAHQLGHDLMIGIPAG